MKYQQNMHTYAHELIMWQMSVGYDDDVHGLTMPDYGLSVFLLIFYGLLLLVLLERLNNY